MSPPCEISLENNSKVGFNLCLPERVVEGLATTIGDELLYRRAEHVVEEIARVVQAVAALHEGNLALFGTLMNDSHNSLQ